MIEWHAAAAAARPADAAPRTALGIALARAGRPGEAVAAFLAAADLDPSAAAFRNLGVARGEAGDLAGAAEAYERAIEIDPDYADAHRLLAAARGAGSAGGAGAADGMDGTPPTSSGVRSDLDAMLALLPRAADRPAAYAAYAAALRAAGRPAEAAVFFEHAARTSDRPDPAMLVDLAAARLEAGDPPAAEAAFARAIDADPIAASPHADLAVALGRQGRWDEAVAAYELAVLLHRDRPVRWDPRFPREAARIGLMYEARSAGRPGPSGRRPPDDFDGVNDFPDDDARRPDAAADLPGPAEGPLLAVLVGCYGDFPDYSLRCLASVAGGVDLRAHCTVLVGLNACCPATVAAARRLADDGVADAVVESRPNLNKDPMMRVLLEQVRTPYVLWLDDDSHFVDPAWPAALAAAVRADHPFDVGGQKAWYGRNRLADPAYARLVRGRPWWRADAHLPPDLREWVPFAVGGAFVARAAYLRRHDYPDRGLTKAMDDTALGDLLLQQGGRLVGLPPGVLAMLRISDGHRRGENYDLPPEPAGGAPTRRGGARSPTSCQVAKGSVTV